MRTAIRPRTWIPLAAAVLAPLAGQAQTTSITLANPNWNITLTDYGYSDFLLDNTPGFEGREYLSGEWGAAVAYTVAGNTVNPRWLERNFMYPDWATNSDFHVVTPITQTGLNLDNLPVAESVISNGDLQITLRFEMLDTVTGTPMGATAASATGNVDFHNSNRYVLKQTATVKNISGSAITGVQFFQLLHGLSSQRGVFDNRAHTGPLAEFQYDTTLAGIDPNIAASTSNAGLEDYMSFHASIAPSAHEIGNYGIEGNGVDDHWMGKPSDGVHLSIENNWTSAPYTARMNRDSFQPQSHWLGGAQRWELGGLAPNQSAGIDVLLSILTGTKVTTGTGSTGGSNGGSGVPGGLDYEFEHVDTPGSCFTSFSRADDDEITIRVAQGEFDNFSFSTPGKPCQVWKVEFDGTYTGAVNLTFGYDDTLLPPGFSENTLALYHYTGGSWQKLPCTVNPAGNTIAAGTTTFGAFVLGVDTGVATHTITAGVSPANSGTITGAGTFPLGSGINLAAVAGTGYAFVNWTENGTPVGTSPTITFNVYGNRTLVANFVSLGSGKSVTTVSLPTNGGTTSGGGVYALNGSATVSAVADPGFKFSKWVENGTVVSTAADYTFTVTGDRALTAKFKPVYVVTLGVEPEGSGQTEVDPFYEAGELAKLKATSDNGYSFVNWTQNGVPVSDDWNFSFNVTGNRELVAHFALGHRMDTLSEPKTAGTVAGAGVYPDGDTVTLVAEAKPGYVFLHWTELQGNNETLLPDGPTLSFASAGDRTLRADFAALPSIVPEQEGPGGGPAITWPAGTNGWVLQESTDLKTWTNSTRPFTTTNGQNQIALPPATPGIFFRLAHP